MLEGRKGAGEWVGGRSACYTDAPTHPLGVGGARRSLSATATSEDTGGREGITTGRNGVAKDDDDNVIDDRGASRTSPFAVWSPRQAPREAHRPREVQLTAFCGAKTLVFREVWPPARPHFFEAAERSFVHIILLLVSITLEPIKTGHETFIV